MADTEQQEQLEGAEEEYYEEGMEGDEEEGEDVSAGYIASGVES